MDADYRQACENLFINPHPFIPAPSLVGGEEAEKQGIASATMPRLPLFFRSLDPCEFLLGDKAKLSSDYLVS
jgi:hypothetical protein